MVTSYSTASHVSYEAKAFWQVRSSFLSRALERWSG